MSEKINAFSASDHLYILHSFKTRTVRDRTKCFKYLAKGLAPDIFLSKFDEITNAENFSTIADADKAEFLQKCMVGTCENTLKKVSCMANRRLVELLVERDARRIESTGS